MHAPVAAALSRRATIAAGHVTPSEDAAIRDLLRRSPMGRRVAVTLEREPSWERSHAVEGPRGTTFVARASDGRVLGVGHRAVRLRWWNGKPRWIGYLSSLRRDASIAGRVRLLVDGFAALDEARLADETTFDLTTIVSDNSAARRLLERGVRGLPRYQPLGSIATVTCGRLRGALPSNVRRATLADVDPIVDLLSTWGERHNGAPFWTRDELATLLDRTDAAPIDAFLLLHEGRSLVACCAVWDQRPVRQVRLHAYAPPLNWLVRAERPFAWLRGRSALPRPGDVIPLVTCSHLALTGDNATARDRFDTLLAAARRSMPSDARWLMLSLPCESPLQPVVERHRSGERLLTELYAVGDSVVGAADGRPLHVEGALL